MFTPERHQRILACLARQGRATIHELAASLGVSADTIRRDLRALEQQGALKKAHGGALALDVPRLPRQARAVLFSSVKHAMAHQALALVPAGATLFLDAGSSVLEVARQLPAGPYTVVTHSLDIAQCLSDREDISLFLAGGQWDARARLFCGPGAEAFVRRFRADWAVLGACGIDVSGDLTASEASDAEIKRAMLDGSAHALLLADHSKFGHCAPHWIAPLSRFDAVITDRAVGPLDGVTLQIVETESEEENS